MNRYATQGAFIAEAMKSRPLTYRQMLNLSVGCSPWRRVGEWLYRSDNASKWQLQKGTRETAYGAVTTWRIVRKDPA